MRYRALLFDLFRTVILYTPQAPTGKVTEPNWRDAMRALEPRFGELLPAFAFDDFLDALTGASEEIGRRRAPEYVDVPIAERYRRAIVRLGHERPDSVSIARELAGLQLAAQSANAYLPPEHGVVLDELTRQCPLALVSNFDDGPMVRDLLAREGVDRRFSTVLISIEFGRRKPHPLIFNEALRRLGARPDEALFIGDSLSEDVAGAQSVGMDTAWVNRSGRKVREGAARPTYAIAELGELRGIL